MTRYDFYQQTKRRGGRGGGGRGGVCGVKGKENNTTRYEKLKEQP